MFPVCVSHGLIDVMLRLCLSTACLAGSVCAEANTNTESDTINNGGDFHFRLSPIPSHRNSSHNTGWIHSCIPCHLYCVRWCVCVCVRVVTHPRSVSHDLTHTHTLVVPPSINRAYILLVSSSSRSLVL